MTGYGEMQFSRIGDKVRIDRADPRALISADLLGRALFDADGPWITSDGLTVTICDDYGKRYIYRVGELVDAHGALAYEIEWPD